MLSALVNIGAKERFTLPDYLNSTSGFSCSLRREVLCRSLLQTTPKIYSISKCKGVYIFVIQKQRSKPYISNKILKTRTKRSSMNTWNGNKAESL